MLELSSSLEFLSVLHRFQKVTRQIRVSGDDRYENDLEHVGQLALFAWYLCSSGTLGFDLSRVLQYALVHDLVEVYAGDTYFYVDEAAKADKESREHDALLRLEKEFPEFPEMGKMIRNYEKREDPESRFVYALDKILPVLNIYLDNGRTWKEQGITLVMLRTKDKKVAVAPELEKYWEEVCALLERGNYFSKRKK